VIRSEYRIQTLNDFDFEFENIPFFIYKLSSASALLTIFLVVIQPTMETYKCYVSMIYFNNIMFVCLQAIMNVSTQSTIQKAVICQTCNKGFKYASRLLIHEIVHSGERRFICQICNNYFSQLSNLRSHVRLIHTEHRVFTCETCGKQFGSGSNLRRHELIHTIEPRYICDICDKRFIVASYLHKHKTVHTGEKRFICQTCNKIFARASNLKSHQLTHSIERKYVCWTCNKRFKHSSYLQKHRRYHCTQRCEQTEMRHVTNVKQTKCTVYVCCECDQLFVHRFNSF